MARGRPRKSGRDVLLKSAELIGWALGGLEREIAQTRDRLAALNAQAAQLRAKVGKSAAAVEAVSRKLRRRELSAAARKRISEGMRRRWAERKKGKG
jgi:uncharacterized coiled-coil protein SlyX